MTEPVTIQSPHDPRVFATVQDGPDGVAVQFCRSARGSGLGPAPVRILDQGVIKDWPFHRVLDHVQRVLSGQTQ